MKRMLSRGALVAGLAFAGAVRAELTYLVEVTDLQRKSTYQLMNAQDFRTLRKTIDSEARVYQKALELVRKDWDAAEKGMTAAPAPGVKVERPATVSFPGGSLSARKIMEKGSFTEQKKAEQRQRQLEDAQADIDKKEATRNKGQKVDKAKSDRLAAESRAAMMLQAKIDELVKAASTPAADVKPDATAGAAATAAKPGAGKDVKPANAAK